MSTLDRDDIYVGYRPLPARDRRFLRLLLPALLWGMCGAGALAILSMRSAGDGQWLTDQTVIVEGTLIMDPYPSVLVRSARGDKTAPGEGTRALLVESGKFGSRPGLDALEGSTVRAEGFVLTRAGTVMLELLPGEDGLRSNGRSDSAADGPDPSPQPVVLRGEIVDTKCFLGAMKPGTGVPHKACAALCLSGGIPPGFVVRQPDGIESYYLMTDSSGNPVGTQVLHLLGYSVEIAGTVIERDGLKFLRCDPATSKRR